jgi:hypothetical protein
LLLDFGTAVERILHALQLAALFLRRVIRLQFFDDLTVSIAGRFSPIVML